MNNVTLTFLIFSFFLSGNSNKTTDHPGDTNDDLIKRVRIDFTSPTGYTRHLLLSFIPDNAATDGYDYGYDTTNIEELPFDLNWIIDDQRCIIQGVGEFHDQRFYPLLMSMAGIGDTEISLVGLENFESEISVFIYDKETKVYHKLNDTSLKQIAPKGDHFNRFYITFSNNNLTLSNPELDNKSIEAYYKNDSQSLTIDNPRGLEITDIELLNVLGQSAFRSNETILTTYSEFIVPNLNTGTYILKLTTREGFFKKKVLVKN